jgi:DNA helicase IV
MGDTYRQRELFQEQRSVSKLYRRLDELRLQTDERLSEVHRRGGRGTLQALVERDAAEQQSSRRLGQLAAAEYGLCFGRLDLQDGGRLHIGRMSLIGEDLEGPDPVLVDWRAPAAEGFYRATPASPGNVIRRRQIRTKNRIVVGIDDEVFDPDSLSDGERGLLDEESALFASLTAERTGRMRDVVATIQLEQDRIVRAQLPGILVVQGGPGTGKTVVALHRAAYLMYTHRDRLAKRGVLIVGPNPTFVRYIDEVLPALGENDVLLSSIGQLYPGLDATAQESAPAGLLKGDLRMVQVLARAVHQRQQVPDGALDLTVHRGTMREEVIRIERATFEAARAKAWEAHEPHNQAREIFVEEIIDALSHRVGKMGVWRFGASGLADTGGELRSDPDVAAAIDALWPGLLPRQFLAELLGSGDRLAAAAPGLDPAERALLHRAPGAGWSPADVPLLDEVAELLGPLQSVQRILTRQAAEEDLDDELAYMEETLQELGIETVNAAQVLRQHEGEAQFESVADRARADRTWTFGHVIVDEAQELSPMVWRMLMRRCPGRSMTVVGDIAQTGSIAGARSWADVFDPYAEGRWRQEHLSLNYRTPARIMDVAADVLREIDDTLVAPAAVRTGDSAPWSLRVEDGQLAGVLAEQIPLELEAIGEGRLAVIAPRARLVPVGESLDGRIPFMFAEAPQALDAPVLVLSVEQSKGLEFDAVLVLEPQEILDESGHGLRDLYVALTRATQRLGILHAQDLPPMLTRTALRSAGR